MVTALDIQHTRLKGEQQFQLFCLKLIRKYWDDDYAQLHGRRGQKQHGADITGADNRNGYKPAAMQCKGSESNDPRKLSAKELIDEVEKAKGYTPKLEVLIVAYSGERDAELQKKAVELSISNQKVGLFKVVLWSWDDIVERALDFPEVADELLIQNKVSAFPSLDPKRPKGDNTAALETAIKSGIAIYQASVTQDADKSFKSDPIFNAQIDIFRDQIRAGNGTSVVEPLRELIRTLDKQTAPHTRFRAQANLGAALAQAGKLESAAIAFDEAAAAETSTPESFAYKAQAALIRGDTKTANAHAEDALRVDPMQRLSAMCLVLTAPNETPTQALEVRLGEVAREFDVGASLSSRYGDEGSHDDALRVARQIAPADWRRDTVVAQAILHRFENNIEARMGAPLTNEESNLIAEARTHLEESWAIIKTRNDRENWVHVAGNLYAALRLSGNYGEADEIVLEAYEMAPDSSPIMERAILAHLHREEIAEAKLLAQKFAASGDDEAAYLAAAVFATAQDWSDADNWANKVLGESTDDALRARAADILLESTRRSVSAAKALEVAGDLRALFGPSVAFESRVAELARILGDEKQIALARKTLESFDADKLHPIERVELSDAFADDGNWERAAALLEGLYSTDRPSPILKKRLFCLFRADRRSNARQLYESLDEDALGSKEIRQLGAAIFERCGMLAEATNELQAAIRLDPLDLRSRLDWARLCIRNDDERRVSRWIKKAPVDADGDPESFLELAQLFDRYGRRKDALRLAYRTLLKNWGKSERLHMMYMSLFLLHPKPDAFLGGKEAAEDFIVFLENEHGGKAHYRIEADADPNPSSLSLSHDFAKKLIGKKVGDTIVQSDGIGQATTWKICRLKHKYLDLFHQAMDSHETTFPGSRQLGRFHVDPNKEDSFEPIFEQARHRAKLANEVTKLYEEGPIPIDTVGKMLGIGGIDACRGLRFQSDVTLDTCMGTGNERDPLLKNFPDVREVMVDVITLSLWQEIGFLEIAEKLQDLKIETVQATIDTLKMRAEEARNAIPHERGSLEAHGEDIALIETPKALRKAYAKSCDELLAWCRSNTQVVPTEAIKGVDRSEIERVLSTSSIDTVATAAERTSLAIFEDRRLRGLALSIGVKAASWTQPLLMILRSRGDIPPEEYTRLTSKLERHRVGFVSVGSNDLCIAANWGALSDEFGALVAAVTKPRVDVRSLIPVLSDFICQQWTLPEKQGARDLLTSKVLEGLLVRPDGIKIVRIISVKVRDQIQEMGFPNSIFARAWGQYVEKFAVGHFIRDALINS